MSEIEPNLEPAPNPQTSSAAIVVAGLWAALAVIFAIVLLVNAKDGSYGGDAYTGIQNAVTQAVRGIAFLLLGSGALGLVIALRPVRSVQESTPAS